MNSANSVFLLIKKRHDASPRRSNVNYISTDLSAQMMSTQSDGQNSDR